MEQPSENSRKKKRDRDVDVPDAVSNPDGPGYICNFCDREDKFHSKVDTQNHYKICRLGPIVLLQNLKLGFISKDTTSYVCLRCGVKLKSKNAINYHLKTHQRKLLTRTENESDSEAVKLNNDELNQAVAEKNQEIMRLREENCRFREEMEKIKGKQMDFILVR